MKFKCHFTLNSHNDEKKINSFLSIYEPRKNPKFRKHSLKKNMNVLFIFIIIIGHNNMPTMSPYVHTKYKGALLNSKI